MIVLMKVLHVSRPVDAVAEYEVAGKLVYAEPVSAEEKEVLLEQLAVERPAASARKERA
jgi:hypothetical protein